MYENLSRARSQFNREAILSASPAKLLTMLYDRLLLDLNRAELAQNEQRWEDASVQLVHAQAIIAELSSSLNTDVWAGGRELQSLYAFATAELIAANIRRSPAKTRSIIDLFEPLRVTWHEAAQQSLVAEPVSQPSGVLGVG